MRAVIGDTPYNQRFLRVALEACGFDDIVGADSGEELVRIAAWGPDLVVYDPRMAQGDVLPMDIGLELVRLLPRPRLLVASAYPSELARARRNGIVGARKWSILQLDGMEAGIRLAMGPIAAMEGDGAWECIDLSLATMVKVPAELPEPQAALLPDGEERYQSFELFDSYFFGEQGEAAPSANAPVLEPAAASTS
ncbi:MAG: Response regulator receiver domain [Acidimicrobiaceae bacterium]